MKQGGNIHTVPAHTLAQPVGKAIWRHGEVLKGSYPLTQ